LSGYDTIIFYDGLSKSRAHPFTSSLVYLALLIKPPLSLLLSNFGLAPTFYGITFLDLRAAILFLCSSSSLIFFSSLNLAPLLNYPTFSSSLVVHPSSFYKKSS